MSVAVDLAAYIVTLGIESSGNVFANYLPATPDAIVCFFDYAGSPPDRTHDTSGNDNPSVQVRVRGARVSGVSAARQKIEAIYNALDGISNQSISGTYYLSILANQSNLTPMGLDENNRPEFVWNFRCIRRRG